MKNLGICLAVLVMTAVATQGELVLFEDFEAYTADASIHHQGDDDGYYKWFAQINGGLLQDHEYANVRAVGGNNVLEIINKDVTSTREDLLDTNFTAMGMWGARITDYGTIYVQWYTDGPTDLIMATNDKGQGFGVYVDGGTVGAAFQPFGATAWGQNASLLQLNANEPFIARNGGSYENLTPNNPAGQWNELWIHFDVINDRCKYYRSIDGGDPVQMMSSNGEWWAFRNQERDNDSIDNIEFLAGTTPLPDGAWTIYSVMIDNIGIDSNAWTLDRFALPEDKLPGDADLDGDVDLADFVILKAAFGQTPLVDDRADFDGDGDVDLNDFVILKTNFGS